MKKLIVAFSVLIGCGAMAQTNVISLRSHAGSMKNISQETDNFGEMYIPRSIVDTVRFIKTGVIIESRHFGDEYFYGDDETLRTEKNVQQIDTLYGKEYTKILTPSLKSRYSNRTVFIGFQMENKAAAPFFNNIHQNGISWVFILFVALSGMYLLRNNKRRTLNTI